MTSDWKQDPRRDPQTGYIPRDKWRRRGARPKTDVGPVSNAKNLERPYRLTMNVSLEERAAVVAVANEADLSISDYLRALVWPQAEDD